MALTRMHGAGVRQNHNPRLFSLLSPSLFAGPASYIPLFRVHIRVQFSSSRLHCNSKNQTAERCVPSRVPCPVCVSCVALHTRSAGGATARIERGGWTAGCRGRRAGFAGNPLCLVPETGAGGRPLCLTGAGFTKGVASTHRPLAQLARTAACTHRSPAVRRSRPRTRASVRMLMHAARLYSPLRSGTKGNLLISAWS